MSLSSPIGNRPDPTIAPLHIRVLRLILHLDAGTSVSLTRCARPREESRALAPSDGSTSLLTAERSGQGWLSSLASATTRSVRPWLLGSKAPGHVRGEKLRS